MENWLHELHRRRLFPSVSGGGLWCVCSANTDNIKKEGAYSIMLMITVDSISCYLFIFCCAIYVKKAGYEVSGLLV